MLVGGQDKLGNVKDNLNVAKKYKNASILKHFEVFPEEDHASMLISKNMTYFGKVIEMMKEYS